jgi:hypothetical protein
VFAIKLFIRFGLFDGNNLLNALLSGDGNVIDIYQDWFWSSSGKNMGRCWSGIEDGGWSWSGNWGRGRSWCKDRCGRSRNESRACSRADI